jgi:hypothetical protein
VFGTLLITHMSFATQSSSDEMIILLVYIMHFEVKVFQNLD